jgi:Rieske Fe-S protein
MEDSRPPARASIDPPIDSPEREGLTGSAPQSLYAPRLDREEATIAPDGRPLADQPAWRQDFPIDSPQDNYVERRDFMKFLVLTSLAFTVGQFWIATLNWWRQRRGRLPMVRVATLADVPVGSTLTFNYPAADDRCVLVRATSDVVFAFSQKCTHLSCAVIPRPERGVIECPCHDGVFDLRTGVPLAGPPRRPLPRIALEVRRGEIYAIDVEIRTV